MEFLFEYGLFLAKVVTGIVALVIVVSIVVGLNQKSRHSGSKGHLEITPLNEMFDDMSDAIKFAVMDESLHKAEDKRQQKDKQKKAKELQKASKKAAKDPDAELPAQKPRVFVVNFHGNVNASAVTNLREEVTAILSQATTTDEVVVRLESGGGMVHSYGLASSQLDRIRKRKIPLTVCVDKVAASGGYMMACVADKIVAAPFAILGSIGVVAQLPNFHKVLKKHDVDFELLTAGEHKRTLTMFGENTDSGREKFVAELEDTHSLFKEFVREHRPQLDIDMIATGEVWFGIRALEVALVDDLQTSDEYLVDRAREADVYEIAFVVKKTLHQRLGLAAEESADRVMLRWWERLTNNTERMT
ncbi:MAG: protease SohB [Porticoccaceae bacterium]|nr:protease SohB [Porticoccaceae bacterium]